MCGIVGLLNTGDSSKNYITKMLHSINHRGPDETIQFNDDFFYGGMNRLSINDIKGGSQPLYNNNKS